MKFDCKPFSTKPLFIKPLATLLICVFFVAAHTRAASQDDLYDPEIQRVAPFQVFDNLYYVGARWVSSWLLVSDQGLILFDALHEGLTDLVIENIRELGFDPDDIRYLIGSHAHHDHIGGTSRFQQEFGVVVMMTEADWAMTEQPTGTTEYPKPIRHLSVNDGSTLNLGRTRLRFMHTPGHTPGVLSTILTVYDSGYPHDAFLFGGAETDYEGAGAAEMFVESVQRIQQVQGIEVHVPTHAQEDDIFARHDLLQQRREDDPHPFVDPESWAAYLDLKLMEAERRLAEEQAVQN